MSIRTSYQENQKERVVTGDERINWTETRKGEPCDIFA